MSRIFTLCLLLTAGCLKLELADGVLLCNHNGKACPDGYKCAVDDTCWHTGSGPDLAMSMNPDLGDSDLDQSITTQDLPSSADFSSSDLTDLSPDDANPDLTVVTPSTGQITLADVKGTYWVDAGVAIGYPGPATVTHSLVALASFPLNSSSAQHSSGTSLNGCTWNRYSVIGGPSPAPDENTGSVTISGFDTTSSTVPYRIHMTSPVTFSSTTISCNFNGSSLGFPCLIPVSPPGSLDSLDDIVFPEGSPSPAANTNLIPGSVTETFTPNDAGSFGDYRSATLIGLPAASLYVVSINGSFGVSLEALDTFHLLDGSQDVTIVYSCDGTTTPAGGCSIGTLVTLSIETSLAKKGLTIDQSRFGRLTCVDAQNLTPAKQFVLTRAMISDLLGVDQGQSMRVIMTHTKVNATASGDHSLFQTAGRGIYAFVDQP